MPLLQTQAAPWLKVLDHQAKQNKSSILFGIPMFINNNYYNAAMVMGEGHGNYFKRNLVPFGEYIPFENIFRGLISFFNLPMSDFTKGKSHQELITAAGIKIAPLICYEIAYSNTLRSDLPQAQLLATISDDAWFGHSWAQAQHAQIAAFQALSSARDEVIVANNGITAIINSNGQIIKKIPPYKQGVLRGAVQAAHGRNALGIIRGSAVVIISGIMLRLCFNSQASHRCMK